MSMAELEGENKMVILPSYFGGDERQSWVRKLCTKEPFKAIGEVQYEYISIQPNSVLSVTLTPHTALGGGIRMLSSTFTAQRHQV